MVRKASGKDGMGQAEILASPLLEIDLVLVRLNHVASKRLTSESAAGRGSLEGFLAQLEAVKHGAVLVLNYLSFL
jgi:hypothetical protein